MCQDLAQKLRGITFLDYVTVVVFASQDKLYMPNYPHKATLLENNRRAEETGIVGAKFTFRHFVVTLEKIYTFSILPNYWNYNLTSR